MVSKTNTHMNIWSGLRHKLIVPSPCVCWGWGGHWLGGPRLEAAPIGLVVTGQKDVLSGK